MLFTRVTKWAYFSETLGTHQMVVQSQLSSLPPCLNRSSSDIEPVFTRTLALGVGCLKVSALISLKTTFIFLYFLTVVIPKYKMVCAKCQKSQKKTELATPGVKRKNDPYFGSPASKDKTKSSATSSASSLGKVGRILLYILTLLAAWLTWFYTEQTPQQRCNESICSLQLHMCNLQNKNRSRPHILQSLRLQKWQRYVLFWLPFPHHEQ